MKQAEAAWEAPGRWVQARDGVVCRSRKQVGELWGHRLDKGRKGIWGSKITESLPLSLGPSPFPALSQAREEPLMLWSLQSTAMPWFPG